MARVAYKQVINRKIYNTETAEHVGEWSSGHYVNDFHYCSEILYRTPRGRWFIFGEGGAMSGYARDCDGNSRCGGEAIRPISEEDAIDWLERHGTEEMISKHFKDVLEDA